ncbi:hypothetical protein LINPERPRIM_LOCUS19477 [Linum perenne]
MLDGHQDTVVGDLLIPGTWSWDEELLEELLCEADRSCVLGMKPSCGGEEDWRIWRLTTDGKYSVKSAYRYIMEHEPTEEVLEVQGEWNKLWNIDCPPKAKHFLWRAAR